MKSKKYSRKKNSYRVANSSSTRRRFRGGSAAAAVDTSKMSPEEMADYKRDNPEEFADKEKQMADNAKNMADIRFKSESSRTVDKDSLDKRANQIGIKSRQFKITDQEKRLAKQRKSEFIEADKEEMERTSATGDNAAERQKLDEISSKLRQMERGEGQSNAVRRMSDVQRTAAKVATAEREQELADAQEGQPQTKQTLQDKFVQQIGKDKLSDLIQNYPETLNRSIKLKNVKVPLGKIKKKFEDGTSVETNDKRLRRLLSQITQFTEPGDDITLENVDLDFEGHRKLKELQEQYGDKAIEHSFEIISLALATIITKQFAWIFTLPFTGPVLQVAKEEMNTLMGFFRFNFGLVLQIVETIYESRNRLKRIKDRGSFDKFSVDKDKSEAKISEQAYTRATTDLVAKKQEAQDKIKAMADKDKYGRGANATLAALGPGGQYDSSKTAIGDAVTSVGTPVKEIVSAKVNKAVLDAKAAEADSQFDYVDGELTDSISTKKIKELDDQKADKVKKKQKAEYKKAHEAEEEAEKELKELDKAKQDAKAAANTANEKVTEAELNSTSKRDELRKASEDNNSGLVKKSKEELKELDKAKQDAKAAANTANEKVKKADRRYEEAQEKFKGAKAVKIRTGKPLTKEEREKLETDDNSSRQGTRPAPRASARASSSPLLSTASTVRSLDTPSRGTHRTAAKAPRPARIRRTLDLDKDALNNAATTRPLSPQRAPSTPLPAAPREQPLRLTAAPRAEVEPDDNSSRQGPPPAPRASARASSSPLLSTASTPTNQSAKSGDVERRRTAAKAPPSRARGVRVRRPPPSKRDPLLPAAPREQPLRLTGEPRAQPIYFGEEALREAGELRDIIQSVRERAGPALTNDSYRVPAVGLGKAGARFAEERPARALGGGTKNKTRAKSGGGGTQLPYDQYADTGYNTGTSFFAFEGDMGGRFDNTFTPTAEQSSFFKSIDYYDKV